MLVWLLDLCIDISLGLFGGRSEREQVIGIHLCLQIKLYTYFDLFTANNKKLFIF